MGGMSTSRDPPWIFRTYAGHSSAAASNAIYRGNLAKGQTGLSIAFDLPTQTGYDSDHPMAEGEVGKVGVPVNHIGDMRVLFNGLPLDRMNTSMTINAPAAWLLALYVALADEQGVPRSVLRGTTQNDIIKEYLARGTYIFPPRPALRLTSDVIAFTTMEMPKWNPANLCSYHLQEAGAEPAEEAAFALAAAIEVLDTCRARNAIPAEEFSTAVGRISFFVNSGVRFVTEVCKLRAMARVWDEVTRERYAVEDPKLRLFRYGVQVNSLGLTEQQPENNVYRILFGMLGVTLSRNARARAVQLPAWNEALGLPRAWDQQWSLRLQQIAAYETDILEYEDIFEGSHVIEQATDRLARQIKAEIAHIAKLGGAGSAAALAHMKERLVRSNAARIEAIESGEEIRIGVNAFTEAEPSPLLSGERQFLVANEAAEGEQVASLRCWREQRDPSRTAAALVLLSRCRRQRRKHPASLYCVRAGRGDHRRVGADAASDFWGISRAHRRSHRCAGAERGTHH